MSPRFQQLRGLIARVSKIFVTRRRVKIPNTAGFRTACKELAFWSASDAGLSGPIEAFDGSNLHPAADGLLTIRMTLTNSLQQRALSDAANIVLRSFDGLRMLILLEIDGYRFTSTPPEANPGVRKLCENFTNRSETTG